MVTVEMGTGVRAEGTGEPLVRSSHTGPFPGILHLEKGKLRLGKGHAFSLRPGISKGGAWAGPGGQQRVFTRNCHTQKQRDCRAGGHDRDRLVVNSRLTDQGSGM